MHNNKGDSMKDFTWENAAFLTGGVALGAGTMMLAGYLMDDEKKPVAKKKAAKKKKAVAEAKPKAKAA